MRRSLAALLTAAALFPPAAARGNEAQEARPAPAPTAIPGTGGSDWWAEPIGLGVRDLRDGGALGLLAGEEDPPTQLTSGMQLTQAAIDVEGDGDEELLQVRGAFAKPRLVLADGVSGQPIWSVQRPDPYFLVTQVPGHEGGIDLLIFVPGPSSGTLGLELRSGTTGEQRWSRAVGQGTIGYFGVSPAGDGHELVMGAWHIPVFQLVDLDLTFISLETGATTGSATITGQGQEPSVAVAGDLDGDGIGDLFALEGNTGFGVGSGGPLRALGDRGTTEIWSTTFLEPVSDFSYVIGSLDATGDGTKDVLIWSEFLGAPGAQSNEVVSIVDGDGTDALLAGTVTRVDLDLWVNAVSLPGDLNGDGGEEAVFVGALLYFDGRGGLAFQAVGGSGSLWYSVPDIAGATNGFGYDWYTDAGDLDGDGTRDALALLAAGGVVSSVGLSQRNGGVLWRADSTAGAFDLPTGADLDGDGADDVVHAITGSKPNPSNIRVTFTAASGRDLTPLWARGITLDAGSSFYFNAVGGRFDTASPRGDLVVEYTLAPSYARHHAECLSGADGAILWTA